MFKTTADRGFTLLELVVVLAIISILAAIALPNYANAVRRAREAVLKDDLFFMRSAIDEFYVDQGRYPESLAQLVEEKYLRQIPVDPITGEANWRTIIEEHDPVEDPDYEPGIYDVRSRSAARGTDNRPYRQW